MEIKTKINKWELINLKCFCTVKVKVKSFSHVRLFVTPVGCSLPGSSVHGIFQARVLEWGAMAFSQGIFPTQGSNPGLPHCRQTLYPLSHQRSPLHSEGNYKQAEKTTLRTGESNSK